MGVNVQTEKKARNRGTVTGLHYLTRTYGDCGRANHSCFATIGGPIETPATLAGIRGRDRKGNSDMTDSTCSTESCTRKIYFRGKCHGHYVRVGPQRAGTCTIDGCTAKARCQKMCDMHYTRLRRHGDPTVTLRAPHAAGLAETLEFTGWTEVVRRPDLGPCWEWKGSRYPSGYGQASTGENRSRPAHRLAYMAWVGPIEDDQQACHHCDNPPCMNPGHIFAGTRKDNMQDCAKKNRNVYGERIPWSKLTENDVRDIRAIYATGRISQRELGEAYGVAQTNICAVVNGRTWARVA